MTYNSIKTAIFYRNLSKFIKIFQKPGPFQDRGSSYMVGEKVKDRDALEGRHMATYGYRAITKAGKEVKGSLEADNKDLAMAELRLSLIHI